MDDLLFDTVSDEAIQMLMEDAINGTLTDEQNKSIDEYLNGSYDFWPMTNITLKNTKAQIFEALQSVKDVREERNALAILCIILFTTTCLF